MAVGRGLGAMGAGPASASTAATRHTVALQATGRPGHGQASYKPGMLKIAWGGPGLWAEHVHWSHWGTTTSSGSGKLLGADAAAMHFGTVTLRLTDVGSTPAPGNSRRSTSSAERPGSRITSTGSGQQAVTWADQRPTG
ncbi:MAG: hypothetical protein ACRDNZ_17465 [Streptosporangiaceae bacterium]